MSKTPKLDQMIAADPDFVDRIFDYLLAEFPQIAGPQVEQTKKAMRQEFAGERVFIRQKTLTDRQKMVTGILQHFNGRNASEVARRLNISRATVYRVLKQQG